MKSKMYSSLGRIIPCRFDPGLETVLLFLMIFISIQNNSYSQNCQNVGFENGSLSGYDIAEGVINKDGSVTFKNFTVKSAQHKLMNSGRMDPIAFANCTINKLLPVVSPNGGKYSMMIGDSSKTGSRAGLARLILTVTPELTFFLLRYAVLLNDPGHLDYEQPRFSLRILDVNGNLFPCGEYIVHAAKNLPGFETCLGKWRVQPWQAVGFELKSYLGQTIQIEIIATDCSKGAHAGYAYIDAACIPLEVKINGYCDGSTANLSLPGGFNKYLWSTGDTTESISISKPVAGTNYSVTVTGATGCDIVLKQTIPHLPVIEQPVFDLMRDTIICPGATILIKPSGKAVYKVFCMELGNTADSFSLSPQTTSQYTFIATDSSGCKTDTLHLQVKVADMDFNIIGDSLLCPGEKFNLHIENPKSDFIYTWFPGGQIGNSFSSIFDTTTSIVVEANYLLRCSSKDSFIIKSKKSTQINLKTDQDTSICPGDKIWIHPYVNRIGKLFCTELGYSADSFLLSPQTNSQYNFLSTDSLDCLVDTLQLNIKLIETDFKIMGDSLICPGEEFNLYIENPKTDVRYTWNPGSLTGTNIKKKLDSTTVYIVKADFLKGCSATESFVVKSKRSTSFIVNTSPDTVICQGDKAILRVMGNAIGSVNWINLNQTGTQIQVYPSADHIYELSVADNVNCDSKNAEILVHVLKAPQIELGDPICTQDVIELNAKVLNEHPFSFYHWKWNNGVVNQINKVAATGLYSVEVYNECGLTSDSVWVRYKFNELKVYLPNVFSPNQDGVNDFFKPIFGGEAINNYSFDFRIYDRWGDLVFTTSDIESPGWNGTFNGRKCAEGVYVWYITASDNLFKETGCSGPVKEIGDVTLVR